MLTGISLASHVAYAAVPYQMNFQGRLNDSTGAPMPNGTYNMIFRIYSSATGGTALWAETHSVSAGKAVTITTGGLFSTQLGSVTSLPPAIFNTSTPLYLEVELPTPATAAGSSPSWTEGAMAPRNPISSSPYAINSSLLNGKSDADFAAATGSTNYIQNQNSSVQNANFKISGVATAGSVVAAGGFSFFGYAGFLSASGGRAAIGSSSNVYSGLDFVVRSDTPITAESSAYTFRRAGFYNLGGNIVTQRGFVVSSQAYSGAYTIQNAATMAIEGAPTASNGAAITNAYSLWTQGGTVRMDTGAAGTVGQIIRGKAGQTGDLLELQDGSGGVLSKFSANGALTVATDSPSSLAIQNAAGESVLNVDTTDQSIQIGNTPIVALPSLLGFAAGIDYPTGPYPYSVASGDFNGDGVPDLVTANAADDTVSILLGNGDGTFQPKADYSTGGAQPYSVTTGDFNGDGKLDLAVADLGNSPAMVSVLLGNGDGTFQDGSRTSYYTSSDSNPRFVTTGDFNGDGKPDLVTANSYSGTVSILLGNGDGTFQNGDDAFSTGSYPSSVTVGDFNGDGKTDLATANNGDGTVSILLGNGDGTFQPKVDYTTGAGPQSISTADFNDDGRLDLAVADRTDNTVSVLLGNGDGTFGDNVDYPTGSSPTSVTITDLNDDGKLDLAAANSNDNTVSILLGNGDGTFQPKVNYPTGSFPYSTTTGDFNGDGKADLVTANVDDDTVSVLINTMIFPSSSLAISGKDRATTALVLQGAVGQGADMLHIQDATGKTLLAVGASGDMMLHGSLTAQTNSATALQVQNSSGSSLLTADTTTQRLTIGQGALATTTLQLPPTLGSYGSPADYATGTNPSSVTTGDFNGDGSPDIAAANTNAGTVSVLLSNGDGTFGTKVDYTTVSGSSPTSVITADFNGDGKLDLAIANDYPGTVSILLGNGDGTFQSAVNYTISSSNPASVTTGDFNGDGNVDLATADYGGTVTILLGNGDGTFQSGVDYAAGSYSPSVTTGDFNGDGKTDLAVANSKDSTVSILLGNGDGTFQTKVDYATGSGPDSVITGDLNGDGKTDLAVANSKDSTVSILLGNGDGTFQTKVDYAVGSGPDSVITGDLNGDGETDLAVANSYSGTVSILLGNGDGTFQPEVDYGAGPYPYSVATGDFNGDGKPDLVTANYTSNAVSVLLNKATWLAGQTVYQSPSAKLQVLADAGAGGLVIQGASDQAGNLIQAQDTWGDALFTVDASGNTSIAGNLMVRPTSDSNTSLIIQNAAGDRLLNVDAVRNRIQIGSADSNSNPLVLVLNNYNGSSEPAGTNGATYYNSNTGSFRCYQEGAWQNCAGGALYSATTAGTALNGSSGSMQYFDTQYTMPASYCTAGRVIHVYAAGVDSTHASTLEPILFQLYLGSTAITAKSSTIMADGGTTNTGWTLDATFTCQGAPSASTVVMGSISGSIADNPDHAEPFTAAPNGATVATNASQPIRIGVKFDNTYTPGSSNKNSIQVREMYVNSY